MEMSTAFARLLRYHETYLRYSKRIMIQYGHAVWRKESLCTPIVLPRHTACPYVNWVV